MRLDANQANVAVRKLQRDAGYRGRSLGAFIKRLPTKKTNIVPTYLFAVIKNNKNRLFFFKIFIDQNSLRYDGLL